MKKPKMKKCCKKNRTLALWGIGLGIAAIIGHFTNAYFKNKKNTPAVIYNGTAPIIRDPPTGR